MVTIVNDGAVLRFDYADGSVDNVSKTGLNIIKTNSKYFTIKNDSFTGYFVYDDVTSPSSQNIDDLISILIDYITPVDDTSDPTSGPTSESGTVRKDLFGTQQAIQKTVIMNIKSTFGLSALRDRVTEDGGGTVTNNIGDPEYRLAVTTNGGRARLRTRERGEYVAGITAEIGMGVRIPSGNFTGNQLFRWGYFDDSDGMYFQKDSNGIFVYLIRNGNTKISVPQSSWNVDRLDGTGPSGAVLDIGKGNIFQIVYTWYGFGAISYRVVITNAGNQFVQTVHIYAPNGETSVKNPNLPLTAELSNLNVTDPSNTSAIEAYVAGRQYSLIGKVDRTGSSRLTTPYVLNREVRRNDGIISVLNVRRKNGYVGNPLLITGMSVITDNPTFVQLRLNGVDLSAQTSNFGPIPDTPISETALEQDTSATSLNSSGIVLYTTFSAGQNKKFSTDNRNLATPVEDGDLISICFDAAFDQDITASVILEFTEYW